MIPEPITDSYDDSFEGLRLAIDRHLKGLAYFNPKVVIHKDKTHGWWTMKIYKRPEWEAWKLKARGI